MAIYELERDVYLDEAAFLTAIDEAPFVFFGEEHENAAVQALELWLLTQMTERHHDVALAMEHFQHDQQPVVDSYLRGEISSDDFQARSQPWRNYARYWKPLVERMKAMGRPVVALNVPSEALQMIYGAYPRRPLDVFNGWGPDFKYDAAIAPRPIAQWSATYQSYFKGSFDYKAHGAKLGLSQPDALSYFTDLAHIRDQTMAYFCASSIGRADTRRVLVVAGDWHVRTGLALPDRVESYRERRSASGGPPYRLVTTSTLDKLESIKSERVGGRRAADFVLVYE